jgi:N utilization substance protein A
MITHDNLLNLAQKAHNNHALSEAQLVDFVKEGSIRAYKAGNPSRQEEDVTVDFHPQTKELRLSVMKRVVSHVQNPHKECTETEGKVPLGQVAAIAVNDANTFKSIEAAVQEMRRLLEFASKKAESSATKAKYQELKEHCLSAKILELTNDAVTVSIAGTAALLPMDEQIPGEQLNPDSEIMVYVQELREIDGGQIIVVSRRHQALVSHAMRQVIPEVDLGAIEIKAVARIAGKRSRVAVYSKILPAVERCEKRVTKVAQALGGEKVDVIEWYEDKKAYIASALKAEVRDVQLFPTKKAAVVELFKDSAEKNLDSKSYMDVLKLAQDLTGYHIQIKLVVKDTTTDLPGV